MSELRTIVVVIGGAMRDRTADPFCCAKRELSSPGLYATLQGVHTSRNMFRVTA